MHQFFFFKNNSIVRMSGYLDTFTEAQMAKKSWSSMTQSFLPKGICTVILWQDYNGKGNLKSSTGTRFVKHFTLGMFMCQMSKRTICISVCGRYQTGRQKRKLGTDLENSHERRCDHAYLGVAQRECKISNEIVANYRDMFESRISSEAKEKLPIRASGKPDAETMTWKVTQRNVWEDIANLRIKRLNHETKSQLHAWMIIKKERRK